MKDNKRQFLRDCALYIKGELSEVRITGSQKEVKLMAAVIAESRKLYLALQDGDLRDVLPQLSKKRNSSRALKEQTGYIWPL